MSDRAHIIEIDRIVLTGVDQHRRGWLTALIEAEVQRVLGGLDFPASTGGANNEMRVAGEVARTVVRSMRGGSNGV
jgi:hypothetical protein